MPALPPRLPSFAQPALQRLAIEPGFAVQRGVELCAGSESVYLKTLRMFMAGSAAQAARLVAAQASGDPANVSNELHRLRGSAASLAMTELSTAIASVETDLKHGAALTTLEPELLQIQQQLDAVVERLRRALNE